MLFSIIIPVYNVENYLSECIQSILVQIEQGVNDCEILLIDDGSTDSSGKICDVYEAKYSNIIKVYHKQNEGLLATRRYGFKKATGEYIINCDSDDTLEGDMLKSVRSVIEKYSSPDMILINYNSFDGKKKQVGYENIFNENYDSRVRKNNVLREYMCGHSIVSLCGKIVKRSCINVDMDYVKYGKLSTGEDSLQSIEFFTNAKTFVYLNKALYNYRCGTGMTARFDKNYYFTFKQIFEQLEKQKKLWDLKEFDELFAIKVLQTAGRAITQSRYNNWNSIDEQKTYLKSLRTDSMLLLNYQYINRVRKFLQFDHFILLKLLKYKLYAIVIILLDVKNKI